MRPAPNSWVRGAVSMKRRVYPLNRLLVWLAVGAPLLAWVIGCAPPAKREALVQEVLKSDPEFAQVLEKQQELLSRIQTYERELALKRSTIERNIAQLRKDLAAAVSSVRQKTAEVKKRMEPDCARLDLALSAASEELQAKRLQRATLGRSVAKRRKLLKSPETAWTPQERAAQQTQIDEMLQDAKRLDQEMGSLKAHIRLLKIKLLLIKL